MTSLWGKWRALVRLAHHERWRIAMGCPGVPRDSPFQHVDPTIPRKGEVYCRCRRCYAARAALGWPQP